MNRYLPILAALVVLVVVVRVAREQGRKEIRTADPAPWIDPALRQQIGL